MQHVLFFFVVVVLFEIDIKEIDTIREIVNENSTIFLKTLKNASTENKIVKTDFMCRKSFVQ